MAEVYTVYSKAGGIAYLGNTRLGFVSTSYLFFGFFADAIVSGKYKIGVAEAYSKINTDGYVPLTHNLVGDPEVEMWTATPQTFAATVTESGTDLIVNSGVTGSTICVMSALDNGATYVSALDNNVAYYQVVSNVQSFTFKNVPKPYCVTVTKHNYIPYTYPQDIYIQNKTLSKNAYIKGRNISAGRNVPPPNLQVQFF